jgi:hypothetical protein
VVLLEKKVLGEIVGKPTEKCYSWALLIDIPLSFHKTTRRIEYAPPTRPIDFLKEHFGMTK